MTFDELIELSKGQLNAGAAPARMWADQELNLAACVEVAAHELSIDVMRDSMLRPWLQQDYSVDVDPVTNEGDLVTAIGSITALAGEIILEGVHLGFVRDNEGNILQAIPQYADFFRPQPTVFGYYLLKNKGKIVTRAKGQQVYRPAEIQPAPGPLTITASYTPKLVTGWPKDLEDDLVSKLVTVALRKIERMNNAQT